MEKYILALDEGTTSARALLVDQQGKIKDISQREFRQIYPRKGWVEQAPLEIWSCQYGMMNEVITRNGLSMNNIAAIGITNQRETTLIWDKETGEPVYNAIGWQCRRTETLCNRLIKDGLKDQIKEKTGLIIDAYFSATKIQWILDNVEGVRSRAEKGELLFGTVDTWLLWKLTGGNVHATDPSNASRTMLFNIKTLTWDTDILHLLNIPSSLLPEIKPTCGIFGNTDAGLTGVGVPIAGIAGDQQAALFGQLCFNAGELKNTYGTGGFLLMNTGHKPVSSPNGLLTTIAWQKDKKVTYALEGSIFMAGAIIQWLRDQLGLLSSARESEKMALEAGKNLGVYLIPAFQGLGTPYWTMDTAAAITGLTRAAGKNHIVRAALESIAYRSKELIDVMARDSGLQINSLKVDGGASQNNFLMQFQSDILDIEVVRPDSVETTALGAAFLAGLATGYWKDEEELYSICSEYTSFLPQIEKEEREELFSGWKAAVESVLNRQP